MLTERCSGRVTRKPEIIRNRKASMAEEPGQLTPSPAITRFDCESMSVIAMLQQLSKEDGPVTSLVGSRLAPNRCMLTALAYVRASTSNLSGVAFQSRYPFKPGSSLQKSRCTHQKTLLVRPTGRLQRPSPCHTDWMSVHGQRSVHSI